MTGRKVNKKFILFLITSVIVTGLLLYGGLVLHGKGYYLVSLCIVITVLIASIIGFEGEEKKAGYLTGIVVFTALSVGSRCLFLALPQVKPIAAIVILSGIAMGAEAGFMTGALSMFISNFYFLQGSWTPYQMVGMGIVGYLAGILFHKKYTNNDENKSNILKNTKVRTFVIAAYGFASVILIYGLIVDIDTLFFTLSDTVDIEGVGMVYLMGLPLDLVFAVTTAVTLILIEPFVMRRWERIKNKYDF